MASAMVQDSNFQEDQLLNEIRILKEDVQRTTLELESFKEKIKDNQEKIKLNKQLPYLFGNIVEILEMNSEDEAEEDGANIDLDSQRREVCCAKNINQTVTYFVFFSGLCAGYVCYP